MVRVPLVYKERPLFGFDVGSHGVKVAQLKRAHGKIAVLGYGYTDFPEDAIVEGIIAEPDVIAKAVRPLLANPGTGTISAKRVATALPVSKVFTRPLQLPKMEKSDLEQAVRYEAEQYVPVPISDLYIDYVILPSAGSTKDHTDVLMVAAPRAIVDSYIKLFDMLDLEIESLEISSSAVARSMIPMNRTNKATLIIDIGSRSSDIALFEHDIRLAGSATVGGDDFTHALVTSLGISEHQANEVKYKFGIGPSGLQPKIMEAISPQLHNVSAEIKKVTKFYKDRTEGEQEVEAVILVGGSASMPGLTDFFTSQLHNIPIYVGDPWESLSLGKLTKVDRLDSPMYAAVLGLALLEVNKPEGQS